MTYDEESVLLDSVDQIAREVHRNNMMLQNIYNVINTYLANHHQENEDDFMRNVLANLISSGIDIGSIFKKR